MLGCVNIPLCKHVPSTLQEPDFLQLVAEASSRAGCGLLTPGLGSQAVPLGLQLIQLVC